MKWVSFPQVLVNINLFLLYIKCQSLIDHRWYIIVILIYIYLIIIDRDDFSYVLLFHLSFFFKKNQCFMWLDIISLSARQIFSQPMAFLCILVIFFFMVQTTCYCSPNCLCNCLVCGVLSFKVPLHQSQGYFMQQSAHRRLEQWHGTVRCVPCLC